ncbi:probable aspartyl protease At4g16563 [Elaeis guineensis]|uniref:Probable aspartyl protease At4g16563 n=1 Tax=Elaeis guineensis var. tenera TaxID=51953 RepID=A0A6I9RQT7_ELAGV|nr:probable aspartyl protease At4g16563 [Elaeis guineensis]
MASPLSILLSLLFSYSLFFPLSSSASLGPVSLPLHRLSLAPHPEPFQRLAGLANASVLRASRLKNPKSAVHPTRAPLFPHSYGGYSLSLAFGTPPQNIPLLLDTGSQLTWIPCTTSYQCRRCASPANPAGPTAVFLPKSSSSARLIGCRNPKCSWIHSSELLSRCKDCPSTNNSSSSDCPVVCPPYVLIYGSGSTAGVLLSESLSLPGRTATDFAVGCSVYSDRQPAGGIAGFGRGSPSIPAQLGLKRFSYCLISRRFDDDAAESGSVVLDGARDSSADAVSFTPFLKNPSPSASGADLSAFSVYYYVGLRKITVGGKKVKIPSSMLVPGPDGSGGTIVDSGTTFTYMEPAVLEPVAAAFTDRLAGRLNRSTTVERLAGLRPCFALPAAVAAAKKLELPEMVLHFKGGAEMRLPLENYFAFAGESRKTAAVCLTVVSDSGVAGGPAIILGNFQQQNYYMVYDLERERLGFRRQSCIGS